MEVPAELSLCFGEELALAKCAEAGPEESGTWCEAFGTPSEYGRSWCGSDQYWIPPALHVTVASCCCWKSSMPPAEISHRHSWTVLRQKSSILLHGQVRDATWTLNQLDWYINEASGHTAASCAETPSEAYCRVTFRLAFCWPLFRGGRTRRPSPRPKK